MSTAPYTPPRVASPLVSLALLAIIYGLFAWLVTHSATLNRWRWDITEDRLYTLSEGTRRILDNITDPIQLRVFFSPELAQRYPALRAYRERVDKLLDEMQLYSGGRLRVSRLQPKAFSREEDLAFAHGLRPVPGSQPGKALFFGISGTNGLDGLESLPFLDPQQEPFLEYDLSRLIYRLQDDSPRQIALLTQLPDSLFADKSSAYGMGVAFYPLLRDARLHRLKLPLAEISPETDLLLVVHPPPLDPLSARRIQQYLQTGGRLLAIVDPLLTTPAPLALSARSDLSALAPLLGYRLADNAVVLDKAMAAITISDGGLAENDGAPPILLTLRGEAINDQDILTRGIARLNLVAGGAWLKTSASPYAQRTLLHSSDQARLVSLEALESLDHPAASEQLDKAAMAAKPPFDLALRLSTATADSGHSSANTAKAVFGVLIADTDWLLNHTWTRRSSDSGQPAQAVYLAFADNGKFFLNLVDALSGSSALLGIPPRHNAGRPFLRVQQLRQRSEKKFHQTEQRLIAQLKETERTLNQWQQGKAPQDKLILTPEQQQELQRFRQVKLDLREKLRAVRRDFDQDVERLERVVIGVNVVAIPLMLALIGLAVWRIQRYRRFRMQEKSQAADD